MLQPGCMDATGLKNLLSSDQAAELRKLVDRPIEPVTVTAIDPSRTQAASLLRLAQLVRERLAEKGVAA